jgi:hypothetical protein
MSPNEERPFSGAQEGLRSVSERWSPKLVEGVKNTGLRGYVPVVRTFLRLYHRLGLSAAQALFVIHLLDFKRDANAPFPSYARIARYMGVQAKAVQRYARTLERKGLLRRETRNGESNRFDLQPLFERVEELMDDVDELEFTGRPRL